MGLSRRIGIEGNSFEGFQGVKGVWFLDRIRVSGIDVYLCIGVVEMGLGVFPLVFSDCYAVYLGTHWARSHLESWGFMIAKGVFLLVLLFWRSYVRLSVLIDAFVCIEVSICLLLFQLFFLFNGCIGHRRPFAAQRSVR